MSPPQQCRGVIERSHQPPEQSTTVRIRLTRQKLTDPARHPDEGNRPTITMGHFVSQVHGVTHSYLGFLQRFPFQRRHGVTVIFGLGRPTREIEPIADILNQHGARLIDQPPVHLHHRHPDRNAPGNPLKGLDRHGSQP